MMLKENFLVICFDFPSHGNGELEEAINKSKRILLGIDII